MIRGQPIRAEGDERAERVLGDQAEQNFLAHLGENGRADTWQVSSIANGPGAARHRDRDSARIAPPTRSAKVHSGPRARRHSRSPRKAAAWARTCPHFSREQMIPPAFSPSFHFIVAVFSSILRRVGIVDDEARRHRQRGDSAEVPPTQDPNLSCVIMASTDRPPNQAVRPSAAPRRGPMRLPLVIALILVTALVALIPATSRLDSAAARTKPLPSTGTTVRGYARNRERRVGGDKPRAERGGDRREPILLPGRQRDPERRHHPECRHGADDRVLPQPAVPRRPRRAPPRRPPPRRRASRNSIS